MNPGLTDKQKQMIAYGQAHNYCILAADPRLGKTRSAIVLAKIHKATCLVVCPAYLVSNWKKEINKWYPESSVTTFRKGKEIYEVFDSDFVVISYDLVQKAEHLFEWATMIVSDELHHLKNMAAKKTQFFHRCLYENGNKYFYGLTGTPIKNRVKEFYSLLALTYYDPSNSDHSFLDTYPDEITFAERFSFSETYDIEVRGMRVPITKYYGIKNNAELKSWLKGRYLRLRADPKDLPPLTYVDTLVSDIADPKLLKAFTDYFIDDADARAMGGNNPFATRKLRTSSVLPEHKKNAAVQKIPFTIKYIEDLIESGTECCLVYSDHREPCEQIAAHFGVPAITGSMQASRRGQLVNDFQSGRLNILCATVGSLKEGADLYRAKDLVLNDPSWVSGDLIQVVNRMRAIGHTDPRTLHRIMGSPQDKIIYDAIEEKQKTIDKAT